MDAGVYKCFSGVLRTLAILRDKIGLRKLKRKKIKIHRI